MNMRRNLPLLACVLLCAACGKHKTDEILPTDPSVPMCRSTPPPPSVTQVRVQVAANGDANPTLCAILSGTDVIWEKRGTTPFLLKFKQSPGTPTTGWMPGAPGRFTISDSSRQFPSSSSGDDQVVRLQIKTVTVAESIDYCVATEVDCVDPGIKILPR